MSWLEITVHYIRSVPSGAQPRETCSSSNKVRTGKQQKAAGITTPDTDVKTSAAAWVRRAVGDEADQDQTPGVRLQSLLLRTTQTSFGTYLLTMNSA